MLRFTIASFKLKTLIEPDKEVCKFRPYAPATYVSREDRLADQRRSMGADTVCIQETFEEDAAKALLEEADARTTAPLPRPPIISLHPTTATLLPIWH